MLRRLRNAPVGRSNALSRAGLCAALGLIGAVAAHPARAAAPTLRVCADPNNLPFSDSRGQGFENKLAELVAVQLHEPLVYTWWPQRQGFFRHTLNAHRCDVVMGVPTALDRVETTRPYYRSSYVFVSRADRHIDVSAITDPRLRHLKIGVELLGADGFNTPPAHALGDEGIVANVVGFRAYGDYRAPSPAPEIVKAVASGAIDIAAPWGPLGGYYAKLSPVPLKVVPIAATARFAPLRFQFDMSMGVRKGDDALRAKLDAVIARCRPEITAILEAYRVPLVEPARATPSH